MIDEGVPRQLAACLRKKSIDVHAFPKFWKGTKNGRLLKLIEEAGYDCFITTDKNMEHQQNLQLIRTKLFVLPVPTWEILKKHLELIAEALERSDVSRVVRLKFPATSPDR